MVRISLRSSFPGRAAPAGVTVRRFPAPLAATIVLFSIIGCYASLLPLGKWHPDEFFQFYVIRADGWHAVVRRIFGWSPRPVSELVLWAYAGTVMETGHPHIVVFLGTIWAVLLLGLYVAARRTRNHPALIAASLVSSFLLLEKPGEMFYWPAAAAAYLLGLGALGMAALLAAERRPNTWSLGAALVGAAWCSEIGALSVLSYAAVTLVAHAASRRRDRFPWPMWIAVAAAALFVFATAVLHRVAASNDIMVPGSSTIGSIRLSAAAALPVEFHELVTARLGAGASGIALALVVKLLLFLGFRPTATDGSTDRPSRTRSALFGAALILAGYGSIVLAFDTFGTDCCERHETLRAALVVLAIFAFAQAWPTQRSGDWRMAALAVPLSAVFVWRLPDFVHDRGLIRATISNRTALWHTGDQPGSAMTWHNAPVPRIAEGDWKLDLGTFRRSSGAGMGKLDWKTFGILAFFDKRVLTVLPR